MFDKLLRHITTGIDNPIEFVIGLILIGIAVNWCATVLHGTRGTRLLRGIFVLLVAATLFVQLLAASLAWERLALLYQYFVIGLAFIALVAFQPELRRALIRAGDVRFLRRSAPRDKAIAAVVESSGYLSRHKYGALIAVQRDIGLTNWAEHGTPINADVTANLLNSIFYPNSALHDLGVIIRGTRILAASCQFPVAESGDVDPNLGSRHRAAVGLSAESDALVLVVSDETGTISLADHGKLTRFLSLDDLEEELQTRLLRSGFARKRRRIRKLSDLWRYVRRALVVVPLTLVIWGLANQASLIQGGGLPIEFKIRHDPSIHVDLAGDAPRAILRLAVRGSRRQVEKLRAATADRPLDLYWQLQAPFDQPGRYQPGKQDLIRLIESCEVLRRYNVIVESVTPDAISFAVDRVVTLNLPVRVDAGPFLVTNERITPPQVAVRLRAADAASLPPDQRFVTIDLSARLTDVAGASEHTFQSVPLDAGLGPVQVIEFQPPRVDVTLQVVAQQIPKRLKQIPVAIKQSPLLKKNVEAELRDENEWLIEIEVIGDKRIIDSLTAENVDAFVEITHEQAVPSTEYRPFDVTIVLPAGVKLNSPTPTVHLRFVQGSGTGP